MSENGSANYAVSNLQQDKLSTFKGSASLNSSCLYHTFMLSSTNYPVIKKTQTENPIEISGGCLGKKEGLHFQGGKIMFYGPKWGIPDVCGRNLLPKNIGWTSEAGFHGEDIAVHKNSQGKISITFKTGTFTPLLSTANFGSLDGRPFMGSHKQRSH